MRKMKKKNVLILKKYFALTAIYLIISLTFFTARALAVLNYDISGDNDVSGFARRSGDIIKINVTADSNVSFETTSGQYTSVPLDCTGSGAGSVSCFYGFDQSEISTNINNIPFMLKQGDDGKPLSKVGNLFIDGDAPNPTYLDVNKTGEGLSFKYSFTDYPLVSGATSGTTSEACDGSGIGHIEIIVQGRSIYVEDITDTKNCTVSGEQFANLSNTYNDKIYYTVIARDRVGNEYNSGVVEMPGDFRAPVIANTFKIMKNGVELSTLSSSVQTTADIVVQVEDSALSLNPGTNIGYIYGDLSNMNLNPAVSMNPEYKNAKADCIRESGNLYTCTFSNVSIRPGSVDAGIKITATDVDKNTASKDIKAIFNLNDNAGTVLYLGPLKTHCTSDLTKCYLRTGTQIIRAELDTTSSYNRSVIYIDVDGEQRFALCKLDDVWVCTGVYDVLEDTGSLNLIIAESHDDYGNIITSDIQRTIYVDNTPPQNTSDLTVTNSNNNVGCSVAGDTLTFNTKIRDTSAELKIYVNTTKFTMDDVQTGTCTSDGNDNWDCTLDIKDFMSTPTVAPINQSIIVEDLAGNQLPIPYMFNVCKASSNSPPNVIFGVTPRGTIPTIDRRTASFLPVKTYIPLSIDIQTGATLMYLTVDNCKGLGDNGLNVVDSGNYFIPNYGTTPTLVLYIGNKGAQLPNNTLDVNCSISARVRIGPTVYTQEEQYTFPISLDMYNNPLGVVDAATNDEMNVVRAHLRDIDKELKTRNAIDSVLGNLCKIAEGIGKANSIAQAVKAVLYTVFMVMQLAGATVAAQSAWSAVQTTLGGIHGVVTKWIWPPGIIPTGVGGGIIKGVCLVYTCKFLDVGTYTGLLVELGSSAVGKFGANLMGTSTTSQSSTSITTSGSQSDNSVPIVSKVGDNYFVEYPTGDEESAANEQEANNMVNEYAKNFPLTSIKPISVTGIQQPVAQLSASDIDKQLNPSLAKTVTVPKISPMQNYAKYMSSALNGHQWIVNPYMSIHYDDTCNPAIIYNLKKDKQINCMYLNCLQKQVAYGLPKIVCDGNYKLNQCLYLDSADYVLNGRGSALSAFWRGITGSLASSSEALTIQTVYTAYCWSDYQPMGHLKDINLNARGLHSAICGLAGSTFALKEILDFSKNPFNEFRTMNPAANKDYCSGIDYSEAADTSSTSQGYYTE